MCFLLRIIQIWIFQWGDPETDQTNIPMSFVAAKARQWEGMMRRRSLDESTNRERPRTRTLNDDIRIWIDDNGEDTSMTRYNWGRDQKWLTQAIYESRLCDSTRRSRVLCWKGDVRNNHAFGARSQWVHFYRHETWMDMLRVYNELSNLSLTAQDLGWDTPS